MGPDVERLFDDKVENLVVYGTENDHQIVLNFNVNDSFSAYLTEDGIKALNEYRNKYALGDCDYDPVMHEIKTSIWKAMAIFGKHMEMHMPQVFVRNSIRLAQGRWL